MTYLTDIVFVGDSREQIKWRLNGVTKTGCLKTGDYSIAGYEDQVAVERKTLDDLILCLGRERERFERELERSRSLEFFAVIVEGSFADLAAGHYISKFNPKSAIESISPFEVRYKIPFLFCDTAALAAKKCESLLRKYYREKMIEWENEVPF